MQSGNGLRTIEEVKVSHGVIITEIYMMYNTIVV